MNIGTVVTPMERGQITIPKAYRDKLGITPQTPLNITLQTDRIVVQPFIRSISPAAANPFVIKAKYTKEQHVKILQKISDYMEKNGPLWTKEDDIARKRMRKKEKLWDW
mgnify:CR=1 FL=1